MSSSVQCPAPQHGNRTAARYGCKCPEALRARRLYENARRAGRPWLACDVPVDATGSRRRVRALYAMGHRERDLASRLGYRGDAIPWMHHTAVRPRISFSTTVKVRALADELGMTPGPSKRLRARAASWGWVSMLGWEGVDIDDPTAQPLLDAPQVNRQDVDEVAVERACRGDLAGATLTRAERLEAVARLQRRRFSAPDSARRLGVSSRQIQRDRGELASENTPRATVVVPA